MLILQAFPLQLWFRTLVIWMIIVIVDLHYAGGQGSTVEPASGWADTPGRHEPQTQDVFQP
jgi:hypothetical protein